MVKYTLEQVQEFKRIFTDKLNNAKYNDEVLWYKMQLNWAENKLKELENGQNMLKNG
jgi:hypothetical protein